MADGEVKIDTKLDTDGINEGLKDLKEKLNNLGVEIEKDTNKVKDFNKELNNTADAANKAGNEIDKTKKKHKSFSDILKDVKEKINGATIARVASTVAIKKTVDALNDCAAAYRVQQNAEQALQVAAKNNPYLNDESVYNLRNFASELQSLSEIGDEVSLQVMSQLAATGRNEEQIKQIMSAAADMAAVTGQDLASAAQQLNATLNGNAGLLGRQIGAINNLTKEELENGRAVELVAQKYKGVAAATADVEVQLSNSWGDFKENIGRGWQNVTQPVKQFFLDVLNNINEATAKTNEIKDASGKRNDGTATAADTKILLTDAQKQVENTQKEINSTIELLNDEEKLAEKIREARGYLSKATFQKALTDLQKRYEEEIQTVNQLTDEYNALSESEKKAADAAAAQATAEERAAAARKRDEAATEWINANTKALQEQIKVMQLKASVEGENVKADEMYNAYLQSYIDLITKSNGLVSENNQVAKNRLATLQEWAQKAKDAATAEERLAATQKAGEAALQAADSLGYDSKYDEYKTREEELLQMKKDLNAAEIEDADAKRKAIEKIDEELVKNRRNLWNNIASEINGYSQQVGQIINDAAQMALETENNKMKAELANLEIKYRKGELGEEEYQKKVSEAKKKGAEMQYKIEMAQWASNILTATANTAVGVTQALAQGGVAGIITGALVGAAGAVQLASIMAAKPIKHFAAGGVVGGMNGASMGADNTTIAARTGEMIMNANQQRALWDMLNGTGNAAGAGGVNLTINNNAANLVNVQPQITRGQIELMIDARVNDGLKSGRFNSGLNAANAGMSGDFYGI